MITVLRYGHRLGRDKRTTTHVALVARAFGAGRIVLTADDESVVSTVEKIVDDWGGDFRVAVEKNWRKFLRDFPGTKVHLTMYGLPLDDVIDKIPRDGDLLVVVGAEKVPPEVYQACDFNVAVGSQPHSEVAALAVFLDRLFGGGELARRFEGARLEVEPQARGKKVNANP